MSWTDNKERCQKIYFGKPQGLQPTREQVGDFIMNKMGLTFGDGPAWSDGVPKLVDMGMKYWNLRLENTTPEIIEEIEAERDALQRENSELSTELADRRKQVKSERAVDRLERIEASILRALCQGDNHGEEELDFVEVPTIVQESGLEYGTVVNYLEKLARVEFGGYVEYDGDDEKARTTRKSAFEEYCRGARLDPAQIVSV